MVLVFDNPEKNPALLGYLVIMTLGQRDGRIEREHNTPFPLVDLDDMVSQSFSCNLI